jgi:hypothetical protein
MSEKEKWEEKCGFCGTTNNAHHSAECVDTDRGATLKTEYEIMEWEEEFNKLFIDGDSTPFEDDIEIKSVKSFIRSLLSAQEERHKKELEEVRRKAVREYDEKVFPMSSETVSIVVQEARRPIYERRMQALESMGAEENHE